MRQPPLLALIVLAFLASAEGRGEPTREDPPARPTSTDSDLVQIRDIFRYADEPVIAPAPSGRPGATQSTVDADVAPSPPARTRLIGLVQRSGRNVAAVFIDGEVLLLGEGESALGFTVIDIRGEVVRLRDPEGNEETLALP